MSSEVDERCVLSSLHAIGEQVIERLAAACLLQSVDAAVAVVVENDDDQFVPQHHRCRDLGIEHEIAAVTDDDDDFPIGMRHFHAETAGDLVAHARVAVLHVVAAGSRGAPQLVQLRWERARSADHDVGGRGVAG